MTPRSVGWAAVERDLQRPTARPLVRCACGEVDKPCGAAATREDMLCDPCRLVTPAALELPGPQLVHVGGIREGTGEPAPHSTQPYDSMMKLRLS